MAVDFWVDIIDKSRRWEENMKYTYRIRFYRKDNWLYWDISQYQVKKKFISRNDKIVTTDVVIDFCYYSGKRKVN